MTALTSSAPNLSNDLKTRPFHSVKSSRHVGVRSLGALLLLNLEQATALENANPAFLLADTMHGEVSDEVNSQHATSAKAVLQVF